MTREGAVVKCYVGAIKTISQVAYTYVQNRASLRIVGVSSAWVVICSRPCRLVTRLTNDYDTGIYDLGSVCDNR
jgi:hypothetical protein